MNDTPWLTAPNVAPNIAYRRKKRLRVHIGMMRSPRTSLKYSSKFSGCTRTLRSESTKSSMIEIGVDGTEEDVFPFPQAINSGVTLRLRLIRLKSLRSTETSARSTRDMPQQHECRHNIIQNCAIDRPMRQIQISSSGIPIAVYRITTNCVASGKRSRLPEAGTDH